jgi:hypothetical protein
MGLVAPRIRTSGPSVWRAEKRRDKDWFCSPEPDDLEHEGLWCSRSRRRPDVSLCGTGAATDQHRLEPRIRMRKEILKCTVHTEYPHVSQTACWMTSGG